MRETSSDLRAERRAAASIRSRTRPIFSAMDISRTLKHVSVWHGHSCPRNATEARLPILPLPLGGWGFYFTISGSAAKTLLCHPEQAFFLRAKDLCTFPCHPSAVEGSYFEGPCVLQKLRLPHPSPI